MKLLLQLQITLAMSSELYYIYSDGTTNDTEQHVPIIKDWCPGLVTSFPILIGTDWKSQKVPE